MVDLPPTPADFEHENKMEINAIINNFNFFKFFMLIISYLNINKI